MKTQTKIPDSKTIELEFQQEPRLPGLPNTLACNPSSGEFFLGEGQDGEFYLNSLKAVSVIEALDWYIKTERKYEEWPECSGATGTIVRLVESAKREILNLRRGQ